MFLILWTWILWKLKAWFYDIADAKRGIPLEDEGTPSPFEQRVCSAKNLLSRGFPYNNFYVSTLIALAWILNSLLFFILFIFFILTVLGIAVLVAMSKLSIHGDITMVTSDDKPRLVVSHSDVS